ncbi:unnamed protein product [Rotaria magnacalcarata]|uniref:Uncharacterized protein n=3 Tax=Rotaria magnacalcarata TaxID=392030 RepID=A0A815Y1I2_9BILA|nr:unnamed protein product [Rotaria magnacalcarata]CAF1564436.1 unnamed protein product [Rotaria magnacalcarata]CAF2178937.1 unnamed protein product [Rotaria magnacalcarata]
MKTIESGTNDQIGLLSDLIDRTTDLNELIKCHKNRCLIHYAENRYKDALHDIDVLRRYGHKDESLIMIKGVCNIHFHVGEVRNSLLKALNVEIMENIDAAINMLNCITETNVNKFIKRNSSRRLVKKVKRLN